MSFRLPTVRWVVVAWVAFAASLLDRLVPVALAAFEGDIHGTAHGLGSVDDSILYGILCLAAYAAAVPRPDPRLAGLAFLAGDAAYRFALLDDAVYRAVGWIGLLPPFSAQWVLVVTAIIVTASLVLSACLRRTGRFERALVAFVAVSALVTTTLFHFVLIPGLERERRETVSVVRAVAALPPEAVFNACHSLGFKCSRVPIDGRLYDVDAVISAAIGSTLNEAARHPGRPFGHAWLGRHEPSPRAQRNYAAAILSDGSVASVVIDVTGPNEDADLAKLQFATLALSAHLTWLVGAATILWFHRRRWSGRGANHAG